LHCNRIHFNKAALRRTRFVGQFVGVAGHHWCAGCICNMPDPYQVCSSQ
jgi:hypothetical protein